jgi:TPR repeat protein
MNRFLRIAVFVCSAALAAPALAQDFNAGWDAYKAGNYPTAIANFLPLAKQGYEFPQLTLGVMYHNGEGVPQDYAEAVRWYQLAAEQGLDLAQHRLGDMYATGKGVPKDYAEAVRWYQLAAEQGNPDAQHNLGVMYANGEGVLQDYAIAHMWLNIASANGDAQGGENRDIISKRLTREQIADAQARARVCMASNYQDCD